MTLYDPHATTDSDELDVRHIPKSQRHPMIFARFDALAAGESFVLVNSHDPIDLREEFARERPGAYDWRYLQGQRVRQIVADSDRPYHRCRPGRPAVRPGRVSRRRRAQSYPQTWTEIPARGLWCFIRGV
jgi:uncharacterized protein (DUF2249 family)